MTPATWFAIVFIAACVALIVWVRLKYPLPRVPRGRTTSSGRRSASRARAGKKLSRVRKG